MFGNFAKSLAYSSKLSRLEKKLKGDYDDNQTVCKMCSFCCWAKPCNLSKEDVTIMAKHFGITQQQLFEKYLVVDTAGVSFDEFSLTPIRKQWEIYAGGYLPDNATYDIDTPCCFLDESSRKCSLHDIAKPLGGREHECWNDEDPRPIQGFTEEELKDLVGWDGSQY